MDSFSELKKELLDTAKAPDLVRVQDIPSIDLYMDQVTTFIEEHLGPTKRREDDKLLTKTMIHNYTKNRLLPPPAKKKYSRKHVILLICIYYLKDFMSIGDIRTILEPFCEACFDPEGETLSVEEVYEEIISSANARRDTCLAELEAAFDMANESFPDAPPANADLLKTLSLIGALSFDILARKRLLESLVDTLADSVRPSE